MTKLCQLTPAEVRVLRFYVSIAKPDKARGVGRYFLRSLKSIAAAATCTPKTVTRANAHFGNLGILIWAPGNGGDWKTGLKGQPNDYSLKMDGWRGYGTVLGVSPAVLRSVRKQVRLGLDLTPWHLPTVNHPTHQFTNLANRSIGQLSIINGHKGDISV